ncbi:MAG: 3-phosphoserine/phosphohydroxythreonine transaminase [Chitinophagia bacterium]|nr:3-phosphoserine/phosphohydroxythreonine transaminase [Chitinophagia bacterium]
MKLHNFNSGPSILPAQVLQEAAAAILELNHTGLSILEIGHRTAAFGEILDEARASVKELMQLSDEYEVLFLHGGATTQFMQVPMNLLNPSDTAAYCINGIWGKKAAKEAGFFGNVMIAADTTDVQHTCIRQPEQLPDNTIYLHITTNNTVEGTQWHHFPESNKPLVADMSSDIFSRKLDFTQFDCIYAGAQKNMGAAGVNLIVIKKSLLTNRRHPIPAIMDFQQHIAAGSLMNTPPVFAVYVSMLTLRWIIREGGLAEMERRNAEKSALLYQTLDQNPLFVGRVAPEDRSSMNAVFYLENPLHEAPFLDLCKQEGMIGVKGYRTVGGIRVSMYNALELSSVQVFCDLMNYFTEKYG